MTFQEFQQTIIDRCHAAGACKPGFKRLMEAADTGDKIRFVSVLLDNHWWCINNDIYNAAFFLDLNEQDVLLNAKLPTQRNRPIDFKTEEIGGKLWKPFNEGASAENGVGDYFTFDEANDPKAGRLVPSVEDFEALCSFPNEWALYQGQFGRLFDNRLFIPAGGYRDHNDGSLFAVGHYGYSWSSSIAGTDAHYLVFDAGGLSPQNSGRRASGLQLRCLREK